MWGFQTYAVGDLVACRLVQVGIGVTTAFAACKIIFNDLRLSANVSPRPSSCYCTHKHYIGLMLQFFLNHKYENLRPDTEYSA